MKITIDIVPVGAVRMTQRSKFTSIPAQRYLNWKKEVGYTLRQNVSEPLSCPVKVSAVFYMPIPASTSKKKRVELLGGYMSKKPDADNLAKSLLDASNGIIWKDDNLVVRLSVEKRYAEKGRIELEVEPIEEHR